MTPPSLYPGEATQGVIALRGEPNQRRMKEKTYEKDTYISPDTF